MIYKKILISILLFSFTQILSSEKKELNEKLLDIAKTGSVQEMVEIIKKSADINYTDENNKTALMYSVGRPDIIKDDLAKAKLLIWMGANINIKDKYNYSPYEAAMRIHTHFYGQGIADKRPIIKFFQQYAFKIQKICKKFESQKPELLKIILENITHIKDIANIISEYIMLYDPFEFYKLKDQEIDRIAKRLKIK